MVLWFGSLAPASVDAAGCISIKRHSNTGEIRFGDPDKDNFCTFASECFGLSCPLEDSVAWPMSMDSVDEELPRDACPRARRPECGAAYRRTKRDCVSDALSQAIWDGHQQGFCSRCQRLVRAYHALLQRCPLREQWRKQLESTFAELEDFASSEPPSRPGSTAAAWAHQHIGTAEL